jgi:bifunctional oligoribonuclease and PAP phosphatase NrnA
VTRGGEGPPGGSADAAPAAPAEAVVPPPVDEALGRCAALLASSTKVLLTSHRRPDGDGSGSMVGLAVLLKGQGKQPTLYCPDLAPRRYQWLPLMPAWVQRLPTGAAFDCTVVVDCADEGLLGGSLPPPDVRGTLITLDHHASARPFGDVAVWDPSAAAVGVLVARLATQLGWPIDRDAATALYVSLISDTGGFRHANTNAEVLDVASRLVEAGASPVQVAHSLEERSSSAKIRLLGAVLQTLELYCAGRVAILTVTTEMVDKAKAHWEDIEGMVNWARNVDGVLVGVMLTTAKGGGVRMSMRSRSDRVDVGKVCMRLGGGGHPGAGGGHMAVELPDAKQRVVHALDAALAAGR